MIILAALLVDLRTWKFFWATACEPHLTESLVEVNLSATLTRSNQLTKKDPGAGKFANGAEPLPGF